MASTSRPGSSVPVGVRSRRRFRVRRTCRRTRTPRGRAVDTDRTTPRRPATPAGSPRTRCEPPPDTLPATSAGSHPSSVARNVSGRIVERSSPIRPSTPGVTRESRSPPGPRRSRSHLRDHFVTTREHDFRPRSPPGNRRQTSRPCRPRQPTQTVGCPTRASGPVPEPRVGPGRIGTATRAPPGSGRTGADPRPGWPNTAVPPRSSRKRKRPPRRRHVVAAPLASHRSRP